MWEHLVAEYAGISLPEVEALDYTVYLTWRRDAFIHAANQTPGGREYLNNAWRMDQTKPDRAKLRAKFGGKGGALNGGRQN